MVKSYTDICQSRCSLTVKSAIVQDVKNIKISKNYYLYKVLANNRRKSVGTVYLSHRSPFIAVSLNGVLGNVTVACN